MPRSTPTAAQREAAAAKRKSFRELWARLAKLSPDERAAMCARFPVVTCEGRALSPCNQMLCASQANGVIPTIVGGFRQWRKMKRRVSKGQHGLMIWVPIGGGREATSGSPLFGDSQDERAKPRFMPGYVFDISQTEPAGVEQPEAAP